MITRRDFVSGVGSALTGAALGGGLVSCAHTRGSQLSVSARAGAPAHPGFSQEVYPPLLQGLRGQHDGSFEVAHQLAWGGGSGWENPTQREAHYDLVVVGAGLSGLAAAHFYRKQHPSARILILDNNDDFGGHARRNEFELDGRTFLGTGGSQSIVNFDLNAPMKELLRDLAVDLKVFEKGAYDENFYARHGLEQVWFFDEKTYGTDQIVPMPGPLGFNVPFPSTSVEGSIAQMPLSSASRKELLALYQMNQDQTPGKIFKEFGYLKQITYKDLLTKHCGVTQPELLYLLSTGVSHAGFWSDNSSAEFAISSGLPGIGGTSLRLLRKNRMDKLARWFINYVHHFPDGNASLARLLVRYMIPAVSDGGTSMESIVSAPFDYGRLDEQDSPVRLRLRSTVINVAHEGSPQRAQAVNITYVRGGQAEQVKAYHCILACQARIIPHLWKEIPSAQAEALGKNQRSPIFYTSVLLRRWHALKEAGIGGAFSPGCLHSTMIVDLPVSLGDYQYPQDPADPIVLYMGGSTIGSGPAAPRERFKTQRIELLSMPFQTFEEDLRRQLSGMLGPYGFEPDADIAGITVNRWPHGFTMAPSLIFDQPSPPGQAPHEIGRRPLGRIAIANCDAGAQGLMQASFEQAWRAVQELS